MKILVTGAKGFIGQNLILALKNRQYNDIFEYDLDTKEELLETYCRECDFIFHLAGVNRPLEQSEFMEGNFGFTSTLLNTLNKYNNNCPVMISSSTQAALDNPYGLSKKAGEDRMFAHSAQTGAQVLVYRFPNVFGKWCRPNYNSAVATFCYNIAHDLPITITDEKREITLVYIDDVVEELLRALEGNPTQNGDFYEVPVTYTVTLGHIAQLLYSFKNSRMENTLPDLSDAFTKKLHAAYLSYLPQDQFSYPLKMNSDDRGSFTEFIRTPERGQFSVNISKPGIVKGNHWHNTKNEKFLVVSGRGVIRFRKPGSDDIIEYFVSGEKLEVVDIPTGYTHNIECLGDQPLVTIMWANECFDPEHPDTYFLKV